VRISKSQTRKWLNAECSSAISRRGSPEKLSQTKHTRSEKTLNKNAGYVKELYKEKKGII
jgi:hypothetical protein